MKKLNIFPEELEYIIKKKGLIPRKVPNGNRLRTKRKYYIPGYKGIVKVEDIITISHEHYYIINYSDNMSGCTSTIPNGYELLKDYYNIANQNIINSKDSYYGYEIKFWFIKNQIDFHKIKYKGFYKYFTEPEYMISDFKRYRLFCDRKDGGRECIIKEKF